MAMPVLSFLLSEACLHKLNSSLREQLRNDYPSASEEQIARASAMVLDKIGTSSSGSSAGHYLNIRYVRNGSLATGLIGIGLGAGIYWAGRITRNRRDLLLRIFRPGLYLTLTLIAVLTLAQAVAAAFALYYFESIFLGRVHFIFMIGVVIGGGLAFYAIVTAMFSVLKKAEFRIEGDRVAKEQQPALWAEVTAICQELGIPPPDSVVVGLEPSFFVTESEVTIREAQHAGRTLYVSLSFCRLLTRSELRAIIGHEMAHFVGEDTLFSKRFFPVYRATYAALGRLSGDAGHFSIAVARLPALSFLGFFLEAFATSEKNLSRRRETEADAVGAKIAGVQALATALVKVHAYGAAWSEILHGVHYRNEEYREVTNLVEPLVAKARGITLDELAKLGDREVPHPIDSHPTLTARLAALGTDLATVCPAVELPPADQAATELISGASELELSQSVKLRRLLTT
ncbi:MAG TPA: M48 family metallopeptidase [Opitutaceae bacterium]|nr:M48 family metallopeptidase [Opitutaceae bacterium]